jgi:hypothetical protein
MRHLALAYPRDQRAAALDDEFLLGPDLLAAPVLDPGARRRAVYLPGGRWIDLWRSAVYREGPGAIALRRARVVRGGRGVSVRAPLDELPLFVRAGAVLPLLPAGVDTLAGFGADERSLVTWRERRNRLRLLAFPRGRSGATIYDGERLRSREVADGWRLRIAGDRRRRYRLEASLRALRDPFVPCTVEVGGRPLPSRRWSFNLRARLLKARFAGRKVGLAVSGRGCD